MTDEYSMDAYNLLNGNTNWESRIEIHYKNKSKVVVDRRKVLERYVIPGNHGPKPQFKIKGVGVDADYISYCHDIGQSLHVVARNGEELLSEIVDMTGILRIRNLNPNCRQFPDKASLSKRS